jgi:hypothetical protein
VGKPYRQSIQNKAIARMRDRMDKMARIGHPISKCHTLDLINYLFGLNARVLDYSDTCLEDYVYGQYVLETIQATGLHSSCIAVVMFAHGYSKNRILFMELSDLE